MCEQSIAAARRRVSSGKKWRKGIRSAMTWKGLGGPQKKRFPPRHRGRNNLLVHWALSYPPSPPTRFPSIATSRSSAVISVPWRSRLRLSALESLYLIRTTSTAKRYPVQSSFRLADDAGVNIDALARLMSRVLHVVNRRIRIRPVRDFSQNWYSNKSSKINRWIL